MGYSLSGHAKVGDKQKEKQTMKRIVAIAILVCACETLDTKSIQSSDACEIEYAVPVPYQGCNRITGEFRVARYNLETQRCELSDLTYSCLGASEEVYVIGSHQIEEVEALVANSCAVCNGSYYDALPLGEVK